MLTYPGDFLRQFYLTTEDGGIGWDRNYYLVFTRGGGMFVRTIKEYEQPYKTPDIHEIPPADFKTHTVSGTSLDQLVARKLDEILPKPNEPGNA